MVRVSHCYLTCALESYNTAVFIGLHPPRPTSGLCPRCGPQPENLLMTSSWQLRLADFGAAIDLTQERAVTRTGTGEGAVNWGKGGVGKGCPAELPQELLDWEVPQPGAL